MMGDYEEPIRAIIDLTEEQYAFFRKANGYCVNVNEPEAEKELATLTISSAFSSEGTFDAYESAEEEMWASKWAKLKVSNDLEDISEVQKIISCSFAL